MIIIQNIKRRKKSETSSDKGKDDFNRLYCFLKESAVVILLEYLTGESLRKVDFHV